MAMTARKLRRILRWWPPFWMAGIRVLDIADDWSGARVELRRRWYNANYVGTHFGGSLFAMADPFWMILVMETLGRDYIVWDKAAEIEFVKAVREPVTVEFRVDPVAIAELRAATADGARVLRWFETGIRTAGGETVARVRKQLHVRLKRRA
jgi:acyl-coenzyme A thioesterase PaaI-like protein